MTGKMNTRRPTIGDTSMLSEIMVESAGRIPVTPRALFERVRGEYGDDVCERRLWRALKWNVDRGELIRVGDPETMDTAYRRAPRPAAAGVR